MNLKTFGLTVVFPFIVLGNGCDSGQYGESSPTEPKAEHTLMTAAKIPNLGESSTVAGALLAAEGAAGAGENAEGITHFQQEHWDVAQDYFNKALAVNADLPEAHYNLALALDKLGEHGEATDHFKQALNLAPEDPRIKDSEILRNHVGG